MEPISFIFINGKKACGKDTQADLLVKNLGDKAIKLSTGEVYRKARDYDPEFVEFRPIIEPYIDLVDNQGKYYPPAVAMKIVEKLVAKRMAEGKEIFIFTGFPRNLEQLGLTDELLKTIEGAQSFHLFFDVSDEVIRERARIRLEAAQRDGTKVRPEDNPEVVEKCLNTYREETYPMLIKLDQERRLISINAESQVYEVERETSNRLSKER